MNGLCLRRAFVTLCLCAVGLGGCATDQRLGDDPTPMTESDEPEAQKRARIRVELATGYFEQGQTAVALDELKLALAADASYVPAHVLRGLVFMRLNDQRLAEQSFLRALQLNPRDPDALHNYAWFLCQRGQFTQSVEMFNRALSNPAYAGQAKTLLAQGVCQLRARQMTEAESSLARSYELDPGNPVSAFHLAYVLFHRGELSRAQGIVRRLNNSELANAETLWLGIKTERRLGQRLPMEQLAQQLQRRYPQSSEWAAYQRGAFDE